MKFTVRILSLALISGISLGVQAGGNAGDGQALSNERCQACHGADGNGSNPMYPRLAGQHASYLERALLDYKSGARSNAIMAGFAAGLSEQQIKDVAAWFASQSGVTTPKAPRTVSK